MDIPRPEYPRPTFVREDWINLNGRWEFDFDDADRGLGERWFERKSFPRAITVPFTFESALSGIGDASVHEVVWYRRKFRVPLSYRGRHILLNFGAVDYKASVWLNGEFVGEHTGGYTPFSFDITESLHPENVLVVRAEDRLDKSQPRGKQHWEPQSKSCFYTRATGIWQTVWLEPVSAFHITSVRFCPDVDRSKVKAVVGVSGRNDSTEIKARFSIDTELQAETLLAASGDETPFEVLLKDARLWSPEHPSLYNVLLEIHENGKVLDRVLAYFGMRKISAINGRILLNNKPCYLRLVLDQGYFPGGVYTAATDDAYRRDIELAKSLGFNGVRKHQKVEDPRYYYWCDRLGLLVWGEMGNCFGFNDRSAQSFAAEWARVIRGNFNHPSIIAWVPFNESWGIEGVQDQERPQEFVRQVAAATRDIDPTRLLVDNSGWSHVDTDIVDIHDYNQDARALAEALSRFSPRDGLLPSCSHSIPAMADGCRYQGQPVVVSEYGGVALAADARDGSWGYGQGADSTDQLVERYRALTQAITRNEQFAGYCYTQLYDIEQEVNGLLTFDRKPKADRQVLAPVATAT